jgi:hypothetical protein
MNEWTTKTCDKCHGTDLGCPACAGLNRVPVRVAKRSRLPRVFAWVLFVAALLGAFVLISGVRW